MARRVLLILLVVLFLFTCLAGAAWASVQGPLVRRIGPSSLGDPSVRGDSLFGPGILGGGPGSGK